MNLSRLTLGIGIAALATSSVSLLFPKDATAYDCNSADPAQWPPPAKPYFMLVVDTSGSMTACTTPPTDYPNECDSGAAGYALNSCGMVPNRINDAKCALRKTVQAFSGEVNFGLETYASYLTNCPANCTSECGTPSGGTCGSDVYGCTFNIFNNASPSNSACGNFPTCSSGAGYASPAFPESTWRNGGNVVVQMKRDPVSGPPAADNTAELLQWFDGACTSNRELYAAGATPIAGSLRASAEYLRFGWEQWTAGTTGTNGNYCPSNTPAFGSPMSAADPGCRGVNVILVTDGDETCDNQASAVAAAQDLYQNGVTFNGVTWPVHVYVINFAGGTAANTDAIAAAGGTTASLFATNELTLAKALSDIVSGSILPEGCNNRDDNCNGCVDEGYVHYCNTQQTCCSWSNPAPGGDRDTCLNNYKASITPANPNGNLALLPCTTPAQQTASGTWLCFDPKDQCDNVDNNCQNGVDENQTKCGMPLHCPTAEVCNGQDENCNGVIDDGVCNGCVPSPEVCDGIDNDCVGGIDNGIAPIACGLPSPANCAGTRACVNGTFGACNNNPQTEICDGIDNNCNGIIDDGVGPSACVPAGTPAGLVYGAPSQCRQGTQQCGSMQCVGFVGPSAEICDGIDNDCDGVVDDSVSGVGQMCGTSTAPCSPGTTACVNGAIVCQGGVQPTSEVCDGIDNNCNGSTDETPLMDAPLPGQNGCWNLPGNCCSHTTPSPTVPDLNWCPPAGGTCFGVGALTQPCSAGTQVCAGAMGWVCQGGKAPSAEVCDGVDNNCNGAPDDGGPFPTEGNACGINAPNVAGCVKGDCLAGTIQCTAGSLDCVGDVGPAPETCNGKDDNCNGTCDDGISLGTTCTPAYDTTAYPGNRIFGMGSPCQLGILACDGNGGTVCQGGTGPSPEVCDNIDNDCDGAVDESGLAPDGLDGTANPFPPPAADLGDACGTNEGACTEGTYACVNGQFACTGGQGPQLEECDCTDEDCDGSVDNPNPNNDPPLCSPGKDCVNSSGSCQCAAKCGNGEFPCPGGQICTEVNSSQTGMPLGKYCLADNCGDCTTKTTTDAMGNVLCAPAGTVDPTTCFDPPECVCKGLAGCQAPCSGVTCDSPLVCTNYGPNAGKCVEDNCFNLGCHACDQACSDQGGCVENPCKADTCQPGEVCKPSDDLLSFTCVASCADVNCGNGEVCKDGACVATCNPACPTGQVCDDTQNPPTCVDSQCATQFCDDGACCDPLTGQCGNCPCEGVVCPSMQHCVNDECVDDSMGQGGGSTTGSTTGAGGGSSTSGAGGGAGGDDERGVWGLATGGGGCACSTESSGNGSQLGLVAIGLGAAVSFLRRRRRAARPASQKAASQKNGEVL
jgi:MYXO-CTERM domain-containing protein